MNMTTIRRELHQIPEPGFKEWKTQQYLLDKIALWKTDYMEWKTWHTGIFLFIHGSAPVKTIAYRTDMDGLPIEENTTYSFSSLHPGMMHACGHDLHMSIALGLVHTFSQEQPKENLLFIFQPAEEGPGGAEPMLDAAPFLEWKPDEIYALHVAPERKVGEVASKPGLLFANTSELFIDLKGTGGHAARPHLANDMVVAASHLVTQIQSVVARNVDPLDAAVVTIGKITGGTKQNIIAEASRLEGTIRTLSEESMQKVKTRIRQLTAGIETAFDCEAEMDWGANYCQVYNNHEIAASFREFAQQHGGVTYVESGEAMTGEDFGYFLREVPGLMFWLGVDTPYGLHDSRLEPKEEAMNTAVEFMTDFLKSR